MAITIYKRLEPCWIKLDEEPGATEFYIRPLNSPTRIDVQNEIWIDEDTKAILISGRGAMRACEYALIGWKGVQDEEGKEVAFDRALIEWLPEQTLKRLAARIVIESRLTETERKNS